VGACSSWTVPKLAEVGSFIRLEHFCVWAALVDGREFVGSWVDARLQRVLRDVGVVALLMRRLVIEETVWSSSGDNALIEREHDAGWSGSAVCLGCSSRAAPARSDAAAGGTAILVEAAWGMGMRHAVAADR